MRRHQCAKQETVFRRERGDKAQPEADLGMFRGVARNLFWDGINNFDALTMTTLSFEN